MSENEFQLRQKAAVQKMREYNSRSKYNNSAKNQKNVKETQGLLGKNEAKSEPLKQNKESGFGLPFLDNILKDKDAVIIICLLLILMSENTDKTLLFALAYILI